MKWYNSLITKITLIFAIALIGIGAVLYIFATYTKDIEIRNTQRVARVLINSAYNRDTEILDFAMIKEAGFELIQDNDLKKNILLKQKNFKNLNQMRGNFRGNRPRVKTIEFKRDLYIVLKNNIVFKTPHEKAILPKILLPISAILFILFLYIIIIRSILPLYSLRQKVKEFANGNYDIECKLKTKDEISVLANEFDNSVKKIKRLRDSRQLFLRNIMHELKTPITKGKLSCEMIEESTYQKTLQNVFKRQEVLLDEFARIEKLSANELALKRDTYSLEDVVDYAIDILSHDCSSVTCKLSQMSLHVDFELFGTAIKNLLDNGINYSSDAHVYIESLENQIIISNKGKELEFPLERYSEPYFLDGKKQKSSRGLGFGLFITMNIINLHNMKIVYNRKDDKNIFTIEV